ncbi:protein kinase domain-containing protein [Endozoicomonas sp.]|uniref:protein kinase domain-containing protein n=1 Tax=Endozoicomonas sp. TaxID=1892382 RepID=UPI00383B0378
MEQANFISQNKTSNLLPEDRAHNRSEGDGPKAVTVDNNHMISHTWLAWVDQLEPIGEISSQKNPPETLLDARAIESTTAITTLQQLESLSTHDQSPLLSSALNLGFVGAEEPFKEPEPGSPLLTSTEPDQSLHTQDDQRERSTDQLCPLSLELLQKDQDAFMLRVANAIGKTLNDKELAEEPECSLHRYGSAGAVIKITRGTRPPHAIKVHFGVHSVNSPPREITIIEKLSNDKYFPYLPEYHGSRYSSFVTSWFHIMNWYPASLADVIKQYPQGLSESMARELIRDLLKNLAALNRTSIMLSDIKPQHILLPKKIMDAINNNTLSTSGSPCIFIANYGHDRLMSKQKSTDTHDGSYKENEEAVDVRSIGMIFYELLTNKRYLESINLTTQADNDHSPTNFLNKNKDNEESINTIKHSLTEGKKAQSTISEQDQKLWKTWCKSSGKKPDDYPMAQLLSLFRLIYCRTPVGQPANSKCEELSSNCFFILCDLLQSPQTKNASDQRKKPYWHASYQCKPDKPKVLESLNKLCNMVDHSSNKRTSQTLVSSPPAKKLKEAGTDQERQVETWRKTYVSMRLEIDELKENKQEYIQKNSRLMAELNAQSVKIQELKKKCSSLQDSLQSALLNISS